MASLFGRIGTSAMKFSFELTVTSLHMSIPLTTPMCVKWTRGPRTAMNAPVAGVGGTYEWPTGKHSQAMMIVATMYLKKNKFQEVSGGCKRQRSSSVASDGLLLTQSLSVPASFAPLLQKKSKLTVKQVQGADMKSVGQIELDLADCRRCSHLTNLLEQTAGCLPARLQCNRQPHDGAAHSRAACHAHHSVRVMCYLHMQMPALIQRRTAWSQRVSSCSSDSSSTSLPFADATALPDTSCTHWRYKQ